jgi:hypothetical protein
MLYRIAGIETTEEATWLTYWGVILGVAVMAWTVFISHCIRSFSLILSLSLVCRPCHIPHGALLVSFESPHCAACSVAAREQLQRQFRRALLCWTQRRSSHNVTCCFLSKSVRKSAQNTEHRTKRTIRMRCEHREHHVDNDVS